MNIVIAADHAGFAFKKAILSWLHAHNYQVTDLGTFSEESVDYPDYAMKVVNALTEQHAEKGILICGSGIGMSIAANRHCSIRAALCHQEEVAKLARQHNDANVLVLGARLISEEEALRCIHAFLSTDFDGGRHLKRVEKLSSFS